MPGIHDTCLLPVSMARGPKGALCSLTERWRPAKLGVGSALAFAVDMSCGGLSLSPGAVCKLLATFWSAAAFVVSASAEAEQAPCRYPEAGGALPPALCESSAAWADAGIESSRASPAWELRVAMVKGQQAGFASEAAQGRCADPMPARRRGSALVCCIDVWAGPSPSSEAWSDRYERVVGSSMLEAGSAERRCGRGGSAEG